MVFMKFDPEFSSEDIGDREVGGSANEIHRMVNNANTNMATAPVFYGKRQTGQTEIFLKIGEGGKSLIVAEDI